MSDQLYNNKLVLGGLLTCAVGAVSIGLLVAYWRRDRRKYTPVGVVSHIYVHPIKSCRGREVTAAECTALGMKSEGVTDRSFLIIDINGRFVTQRQQPSIAVITPTVSEDFQNLVVNAPGMPTLIISIKGQNGQVLKTKLWGADVMGEDCGSGAQEWLEQYLGSPGFKLIRHSKKISPKMLKNDKLWAFTAKGNEKSMYQDVSQINILGVSSLDDLNSKLETPVQFRNFRPNIVVEGSPAFQEDKWKYVRIGDSAFLRKTHLCARCRQTTVDPDTGKFSENGDPIKTLKNFRMATPDDPDKAIYGPSPLFGINLAVERVGHIKIGDVVYAAAE